MVYSADILAAVDVLDLYIDKKNRVWILDFDVFSSCTDALLFSWEELDGHVEHAAMSCESQEQRPRNEGDQVPVAGEPIMRVVENPSEVFPSPAGAHRGPVDVTEVSNPVSMMMKLTQMAQQDSSSSDDEKSNDDNN